MIRTISALAFAFLVPLANAQEAVTSATLNLKQPVAASLASGGSDSYVFEAEAGQYVAGFANQLSVDVVVKVFNPDGGDVAEFDGPAVGPEHFSFETKSAGQYRIEVAALEENIGDYSLTLSLLEAVATEGSARVDQLMTAYSGDATPGGVVIVVKEGKVLFEKAYGMSNLTHSIPFSADTPSNLGSVSKQFTAFAICMLESQGLLSLDDDVRKHIPELPDLGETVTLRHMLTHTSGYREFLNTIALTGRRLDKGDYIDRKELITILQHQPGLQNSPGSEFNYNNTSFGLLTVVLERVTEETFPAWMKSNVFEPLGMTSTVVRADATQLIPDCSQGYALGPYGFQDSRDLGGAMGAGGIYSTTGDMAKWMRNLQTGELGGAKILGAMTTPYTLTTGEATGYGLGLIIDEKDSLRRFQHGGADSAHRAKLIVYPDIEAGVVALSNNAYFDSAGLADKIAKAFFSEYMTAAEEEQAPLVDASSGKQETFDPAAYRVSDFDELVGRYELEEMAGFILTFTREGDKLLTQGTGQPQIEIDPTGELTFEIQQVKAGITFHRDADGKVTSLTLNRSGNHKAKRLGDKPWAPTAEQLAIYEGRYFSAELETFYTIAIDENRLVAQHRRLDDAPLDPGKEHTFRSGRGVEFEFKVDDAGEVTGYVVSGGRARGIDFTRMTK